MAREKSAPQTLQTVERALAFLEAVAETTPPETVQGIAKRLDLNITTAYHLMRTLIARGYLDRRADNTLRLGAGIGLLFRSYQLGFDLTGRLAELIRSLRDTTTESAFLSVVSGTSVVIRVLAEGTRPLRVMGLEVGMSGDEHRRASGKAVLAHLSPEDREQMLERAQANLPAKQRIPPRRFDDELQLTRSRGWAGEEDRLDSGISSIGAPVFDAGGAVYGAVGIVAPTTRMQQYREDYIAAVLSRAEQITGVLRDAP